VLTDYEYDALNRLDTLTHYRPDNTPDDLSDNPKLAEFDYEVLANGSRSGMTEQFWLEDDAQAGDPADLTNTYSWTYDRLNRLIDEIFTTTADDANQPAPLPDSLQGILSQDLPDTSRPLRDFADHYSYDLTGNRLAKTTALDNDGSVDEVTVSEYDSNDRLLSSTTSHWLPLPGGGEGWGEGAHTVYGYDATQQISKTVYSGTDQTLNSQLSTLNFTYDFQGRLAQAVTEQFTNGNLTQQSTATYDYGPDGIRIRATQAVATDHDGDPGTDLEVTSREETEFLVDARNHTGYQQVLVQKTWSVDDAGNRTLTEHTVYTLGHDVLSQTTIDPATGQPGETLVLIYDGHGSTRMLSDAEALLPASSGVAQLYHYDAYGVALGFSEATAATTMLYSGEQFDQRVEMQYLRARYYAQGDGQFVGLDPYFGNVTDPQSFHKYLYTHANPTNLIDPTGMMGDIISTLGSMASSFTARGIGAPAMAAIRFTATAFRWAVGLSRVKKLIGLGAATIGGTYAITRDYVRWPYSAWNRDGAVEHLQTIPLPSGATEADRQVAIKALNRLLDAAEEMHHSDNLTALMGSNLDMQWCFAFVNATIIRWGQSPETSWATETQARRKFFETFKEGYSCNDRMFGLIDGNDHGMIRVTFSDGETMYLDNGWIGRYSGGASGLFGSPNIPIQYTRWGELSVDDSGANGNVPDNIAE
jgi:RHS repeat-associated protein